MTTLPPCLRVDAEGRLLLDLQVVPGARRSDLVGLIDGRLKLRLAAQAVDGQANAALLAWVAAQWGWRVRELELVAGLHARRKTLRLARLWSELEPAWQRAGWPMPPPPT